MWNQKPNLHQPPPPPIHQQPPQHSMTSTGADASGNDAAAFRSKDLASWAEAFDKHELVDILVRISKNNTQFQSYLGHAFVTDIKWCKIRVTFTPSSITTMAGKQAPNSTQIQDHFSQYGGIRRIECFPVINAALITYDNYTYAQSAVSVGVHQNVASTNYNASCCYEFEGAENASSPVTSALVDTGHALPQAGAASAPYHATSHGMHMQQHHHGVHGGEVIGGPLEQRRLFVSSLSYSTLDQTLENVFSQYGELEDCTIVKDKVTMRSKGYGFVVFKGVSGASQALKQPEKIIDGRRTRCWLAAQGNQFKRR